MSNSAISLKPIDELLSERFFVPSYQRGYRWKEQQVTELLDDIWEFQKQSEDGDRKEFYCLQPIVVQKRKDDRWELVDGQQRLTTIYLILSCLANAVEMLDKSKFGLEFETREETSGVFLEEIDLARRDENIDYFHICEAYEAIDEWFGKLGGGSHKLKFLQCLLNPDDIGKNVKVIWYELPSGEYPIEAFLRLNVGKIPLTNSELVRALFLRSKNFPTSDRHLEQLRIAHEWDGMEKSLQSDDFWYFLHNGKNIPPNRIEYVFLLTALSGGRLSSGDPYATFHWFHERFQDASGIAEAEWHLVKRSFMLLEEWFNDRTLYHLVGFLVHEGTSIASIRVLGEETTKSRFRKKLIERIGSIFGGIQSVYQDTEKTEEWIREYVGSMEYPRDRNRIRAVLLLFNIATLLQNPDSNLRFPFISFKKESWHIEHVRSVESGMPTTNATKRRWLKCICDYFEASGLEAPEFVEAAVKMTDSPTDLKHRFDALYEQILDHFDEPRDDAVSNGIENLALLDAGTNTSYKNAVFPVKRQRILGLDRQGTFVPLCTKNVFLKCYSKNVDNMMFWTSEDGRQYREEIIRSLADFFQPEKGGDQ